MRDSEPDPSRARPRLVETYLSARQTKLPVLVRYNTALCLFDEGLWIATCRPLDPSQDMDASFGAVDLEVRRTLAPLIFGIAPKVETIGPDIVQRVEQEISDVFGANTPLHDKALIVHLKDVLLQTASAPLSDHSKWVSHHCPADVRVDDPPMGALPLYQDLRFAVAVVEGMFAGLKEAKLPPPVLASFLVEQDAKSDRTLIEGETDLKTTLVFCPPGWNEHHTGQIKLKLPRELTEMNSFALSYVAAHEVGVHLFERIHATQREATSLGWGFCEGFVDSAVYAALVAALEQDETRSQVFYDGVYDRHTMRPAEPPNRHEKPAGLWTRNLNLGRRAFANVLEVARCAEQILPGPLGRRTPEIWAQQVAMMLNLMDLSDVERAHLVAAFTHVKLRAEVIAQELAVARDSRHDAGQCISLAILNLGQMVLEEVDTTDGGRSVKVTDYVRCFLDLATALGVRPPKTR